MDKPDVVHPCGGTLFSLKKEGDSDTCCRRMNSEDVALREISHQEHPTTTYVGLHAHKAPGEDGK